MAKRKRTNTASKSRATGRRKTASPKSPRSAKPRRNSPPQIRPDSIPVQVANSGLEVWLYDDASTATLKAGRVRDKLIGGGKTDGRIVGYELHQDDELRIEVLVGPPLTTQDLSVARWLEPQVAFIRLPSGQLVVESNDTCRVGGETPTEEGMRVAVPPGDYRLTLYRINYEALDREELEWQGPQEVVVLTPGGKPGDDVAGLLPLELRRDTSWVGKLSISGSTARGLVWFDDPWDTYFANIDQKAVAQLGLKPGGYLRTTVPAANLVMITAFANSWEEGQKLEPPADLAAPECGYGSIIQPERWGPHETLLCRRVKSARPVENRHRTQWLEAHFEVLDLAPVGPPDRVRGPLILDTGKRAYWKASLADRTYYGPEEYTLCMKLDGRVPGISFEQTVTLAEAVKKTDAALAKCGLKPLGDFSFDGPGEVDPVEYTVRAYGGGKDYFAAIWASVPSFEVSLFSRVEGKRWVLTSTMDEDDAQQLALERSGLSVLGIEEEMPLAKMIKEHARHLARIGGKPDPAPKALEALVRLYDDYLGRALG